MSKVDVLLVEPIATIQPGVYGHFAEHLGECIYNGIWVGEESKIPNTGGIRNDVVAALRRMKAPVIRWPGGCFADDYHWQDGIGPQNKRPRRINIHWGEVVEDNAFGTEEFIRFCRLVGAAPYFCGNVGSGSPREMRDWVEYCNFPGGTTWSDLRIANAGSPEPHQVYYWGVGNENWGCGGHFIPEDYATEYRRFSTFMREFAGQQIYRIACGPSSNDPDWTRRFLTKLYRDYGRGNRMEGYAAHYYCGTAGTATEYTVEQWYELLEKGLRMEELVKQQRAIMDTFDPQRQVGLIVDEWGTWHPAEPGRNPRFLWQQNTMRDALVAATTLNIFNNHADKVVMSNIAQTINVLQAVILTQEDKLLVTPTGHVYEMYALHQSAQAVRALVDAPQISFGKGQSVPHLSASASLKGKELTLTLCNLSATDALEVEIALHGGQARSLGAVTLAAGDIHAHNTFEQPEMVAPQVDQTSGLTHQTLPPASVTRIDLAVM
jgi:alpha-N-arabinofuranosidase